MNYFDCAEKKNINIRLHKAGEPILVGASLDANGKTYYEFRETIAEEYTCVIDAASGVVRYLNEDASTISPGVGERVFGIDEYPEDLAFDGSWIYNTDSGEFSQCAETVAALKLIDNTRLRIRYATQATLAIATLQNRVSIGRVRDGDTDALTAWQNYLIDLDELTDAQLTSADFVFPSTPQ